MLITDRYDNVGREPAVNQGRQDLGHTRPPMVIPGAADAVREAPPPDQDLSGFVQAPFIEQAGVTGQEVDGTAVVPLRMPIVTVGAHPDERSGDQPGAGGLRSEHEESRFHRPPREMSEAAPSRRAVSANLDSGNSRA
jgi:hypothetical protein